MVVTGLGAMILKAEMEAPRVPAVHPTIKWENDTEENRKDKSLMWITDHVLNRKYRFRGLTQQEKQERKQKEEEKLRFMFQYILEHYGWRNAEAFRREWDYQFEKAGVEISFDYPHCRYTRDGQCDIFCPYFNGRCQCESL